jgi:hypothetical protein
MTTKSFTDEREGSARIMDVIVHEEGENRHKNASFDAGAKRLSGILLVGSYRQMFIPH